LDKQIKFIWDFRGPASFKTAVHHEKHLKEFIVLEQTAYNLTGHKEINEMYSIAFMVVSESEMIPLRDKLKPHRGEIYTP